MPNWSESMQQTFEYYIVDPGTWKDKKKVDTIKSSTVNRDRSADTLGSASFDITESLGECYIRIYLITIQNGVTEKHPLGTYLIQTPSTKFDGKNMSVTMDAYTPLIELKENPPPIGYYTPKGENIMQAAYMVARDNCRAPIVPAECDKTVYSDFIADTNDTWLSYTTDLIANAKFTYDLDELGRILFAPKQDTASLQPVWTYNDDNSSILYPEITMDHDLYGVPNIIEVIHSKSGKYLYSRVVNDDSNSPTSTVNRGREIIHRVTDPDMAGIPSQAQIDEYATQLLREMSSIEYTVSYTHGYCPVRTGDCVRLNYKRAGMTDIKARVIDQSIKCEPGCSVTEKAVYTVKLWG